MKGFSKVMKVDQFFMVTRIPVALRVYHLF